MVKDIAIIGSGGLGREIAAIIKAINNVELSWNIIGFFDDSKQEKTINGLPYLGTLNDLKRYSNDLNLVVGIGNPRIKKEIVSKVQKKFNFPNIIHPSVSIDVDSLTIGQGNVIAVNTVLTVNVSIANFVYINTGVILAHDVSIDDYTMIMPSVSISAGARIGKEVYIGNGTKIDQPIEIQDQSHIPLGQLISHEKVKSNKVHLSSLDVNLNQIFSYYFEAIQNNEVTTRGNNIDKFEESLENYLGGGKKVAALSAGTAAIHLALIKAGVKYGDEVICQSFTFSASANPIVYQGANPIFVDSEEETWNMCPLLLEKAINERINTGKKPKAIIVVHLYGMPAKIDEIVAIAKKYKIVLIEDAAEALGSSYKGQKCGTFGDYGILSFNGNKIITTSGGGALVCKNKDEKDRAIFLATQARDHAPHYEHSTIGYNYRMSNIVAGIGRGQMEVLDKHISLRQEMNTFYKEIFEGIKGITVLEEPNKNFKSNHWLSCILVNEKQAGFTREDLRLVLQEDNIESRPLWKPMHMQPVFEKSNYYGSKFSEQLFKTGLCLPSGSNLTKAEKNRIEKVIYELIKK